MKKFKLTWDERVTDHDDEFLYIKVNSQIVEAESEDAACEQWKKENEHNEYQTELSDCVEIIECDLFKKHLLIDMPDGLTYSIPVEVIARNRAQHYAFEFEGDEIKSLLEDTIPLFEFDELEIRDWSSNNMNWSDVESHAITLKKKVSKDEFNECWVNGKYKIT